MRCGDTSLLFFAYNTPPLPLSPPPPHQKTNNNNNKNLLTYISNNVIYK